MATIVKQSILNDFYPERSPGAHKGDFGHLLIVGGSFRYTGAPALQALAALRAGVDRVTVAAPRRAADAVASMLPDAVTVPMEGGVLAPENIGPLTKELEGKSALAIGNGLGRDERTLRAVAMLLEKTTIPVIADADALYALAERKELLETLDVVVAPHSTEFAVMTGDVSVAEEAPARRLEIVEEEAKNMRAVVLLKGHNDVISDGETTVRNETGTPLMTVGGTGDVLAGVVGALLARGVSLVDAAAGAAWITGRAGEIAGEEYGESLIASDVVEAIPDALRE